MKQTNRFSQLYKALTASVLLFIPFVSSALVTQLDPRDSTHEATLHQHMSKLFPNWSQFPHWHRVGRVAEGTGVYLGNGLVLTAAHVGAGAFIPQDGTRYQAVPGSLRNYTNPDGSHCDLSIFNIIVPAGSKLSRLPYLKIRIGIPPQNSILLMIGSGASRQSRSLSWADDRKLRWGINRIGEISNTPFSNPYGRTKGYYTNFGKGYLDCQGAPGDSGGAAFYYDSNTGTWQLAGLIVAGTAPHERNRTNLGDRTFIASLSPIDFNRTTSNSSISHASLTVERGPKQMVRLSGKNFKKGIFRKRSKK